MRSAVRLIPLMVIGALAAFLLVGPLASLYKTHAAASRPPSSLSPSPTATPRASTSCPSALPMPAGAPATIPTPQPTFPFAVWVNDPLGVNLRTAPSTSGTLIKTLNQGTQATADREAVDASAAHWYHVTTGSQSGWLRADFVVNHAVHVLSGEGWSLMLPEPYQGSVVTVSVTQAAAPADPVPFLRVQTNASRPTDTDLPAIIDRMVPASSDHAKQIQVWSYTVIEYVSRVPIDTCTLSSAGARRDGGWPYMTWVQVHSSQRWYTFTFFAQEPNSALVQQVLDSVAVS